MILLDGYPSNLMGIQLISYIIEDLPLILFNFFINVRLAEPNQEDIFVVFMIFELLKFLMIVCQRS
jgi:hypothetical protein